MSHQNVLRSVFASVNLGEPRAFAGWKLFPMFPTVAPGFSMLTAHTAVAGGLARLEELPQGPSIRSLRFLNAAPVPVLVRDGDLFVSGRQDRIADRPMLVPANHEVDLPVSCVERDRWAVRERADFEVFADSAAVPLRHRRMKSACEHGAPDQQSTWDAVAERRRAQGFDEEGGSLVDVQRHRAPDVEAAVKALSAVYGAAGLVLCHGTPKGPRVALVEWFADPAACADAWTGIVRGALSSLPSHLRAPHVSRTELRARFDALASAPCRAISDDPYSAVLGFAHGSTQGQALAHDGRTLHLVAIHA